MPFSASIIQRDFLTVFDKALLLGGASYVRRLSFGSMWSRIRIGALVSVTPNGTNNLSDMLMTLGLCSGMQYPGSSNLPASAFGASIIGIYALGSTNTLSYTANSGFPYFVTSAGSIYRRQGAMTTNSVTFGQTFFLPVAYTGALASKRRFPIIVDITRSFGGSGAASVIVYGVTTAATAQNDFRPDDLQSALDQLGTPSMRGLALTPSTTVTTVSIGDETGPLDTFELFWAKNNTPLEVYAVGATIIYQTYNSGTAIAYSGSGFGGAADDTTQYLPAAQVMVIDNSIGTGWGGSGTLYPYGYSNGTVVIGLPGTSGGFPADGFQQYATGSVTSNVTINAGTGWTSNGFIY